jgi:hypothetical protein
MVDKMPAICQSTHTFFSFVHSKSLLSSGNITTKEVHVMSSRTIQLFRTPFLSGELLITEDGLYPKVTTAPAAVALPYRFADGDSILDRVRVVLFQREGVDFREEDAPILKTVGSYLKDGETYEDCARRNLRDRLGIAAKALEDLGEMLGYTNAHVQTRCFLTEQWSVDESIELPPQFKRVEVILRQALNFVYEGKLLDEASTVPIMRLALRVLGA